MKIQVLGTGCQKCKLLAEHTEQAVAGLGLTAEITKVTDLKEIMAFGVMMTPALVVDGKVVVGGRLPSKNEIKNWIGKK